MKVYGYTKDKQGIMEIENSLKAEQAFVGGLIECTALTEEIDLICNEEGTKVKRMTLCRKERNHIPLFMHLMYGYSRQIGIW